MAPKPTSSTTRTQKLIFIIGAPAAGKGTLCDLLAQNFNLHHLSIGDYCRALSHETSTRGRYIGRHINNEKSVPSHYMVQSLLAPKLADFEKQKQVQQKQGNVVPKEGVLVDGFPRRKDHLDELKTAGIKPDLVLRFHCPKQEHKRRFLTRKLKGREGDDEGLFERRWMRFNKESGDVVRYFEKEGCILAVDTRAATKESYAELLRVLQGNEMWRELSARGKAAVQRRSLRKR